MPDADRSFADSEVARLERSLEAARKTIETLADVVESDTRSIRGPLEENVELESIVRRKTEELERERAKLAEANVLLETRFAELARQEMALRQAQKLEAVGRLAAGVAHEINTPIQFVSDSIYFVRDAVRDLAHVIDRYRAVRLAVTEGRDALSECDEAANAEVTGDLEYTLEHVPKALDRAVEGLDRVAKIVTSMKEFAHPDTSEKTLIDLNHAVESTLTIARNEYKYVADVLMELGDLPSVECHGGEINQVILNLVVNAAHAIADMVRGRDERGTITVRTRVVDDDVELQVADTGTGIPESEHTRIFDPFFTTKEVGRGTGQGLAIAHNVITEKHGGTLSFTTKINQGTTFFVRFPLRAPERLGTAQGTSG